MVGRIRLCLPRGMRTRLGGQSFFGVACWICSVYLVYLYASSHNVSTTVKHSPVQKNEIAAPPAVEYIYKKTVSVQLFVILIHCVWYEKSCLVSYICVCNYKTCCSFMVSLWGICLKAPPSSFCDDSNLRLSDIKYVLSTMGVSKESISKFLIGNRFHVKLRILSPENCKQSLQVKSWKAEVTAEKKQTQNYNRNFVIQVHKS